jgi:hypothetical protein
VISVSECKWVLAVGSNSRHLALKCKRRAFRVVEAGNDHPTPYLVDINCPHENSLLQQ